MNRKLVNVIIILIAVVIIVWSLFPLYWTIVTSVKSKIDIYSYPPTLIPNTNGSPTTEYWLYVFNETLSGRAVLAYYRNSILAASTGLVVCLALSIPAAYALARWTFRGREDLAFMILTFRFLPPATVVIPIFIFYRFLGLLDTPLGLGLIYGAINAPIGVWVLRSYFVEVPSELEESYMLDGYSRWRAVLRILIPLSIPGIISVGILVFALSWGELLFAVFLTSSPVGKTIPVGIAEFLGGEKGYEWEQIACIMVAAIIPLVVAFTLIRKYLARGLTLGAVR
jgi:multiple sugar transport system permease protein